MVGDISPMSVWGKCFAWLAFCAMLIFVVRACTLPLRLHPHLQSHPHAHIHTHSIPYIPTLTPSLPPHDLAYPTLTLQPLPLL